MLETKYVGGNYKMWVTVLAFLSPKSAIVLHSLRAPTFKRCHQLQIFINITVTDCLSMWLIDPSRTVTESMRLRRLRSTFLSVDLDKIRDFALGNSYIPHMTEIYSAGVMTRGTVQNQLHFKHQHHQHLHQHHLTE